MTHLCVNKKRTFVKDLKYLFKVQCFIFMFEMYKAFFVSKNYTLTIKNKIKYTSYTVKSSTFLFHG